MHFRLHLTRRFRFIFVTIFAVLLTLASPALLQFSVHASEVITPNAAPKSTDLQAPLFDNLGDHQFPVSTPNPLAQRYVNQGLTLAYGFNHAEAFRSFKAAAELDPTCAMCHWGMAYVLGPNINAAMQAGDVPTAYQAVQSAIALSPYATEREQAYIQALAKRYTDNPNRDRSELDQAYADAMAAVAQQYPDDPDAATLYAEALMDTMPWDYWTESGEPRPKTVTLLDTLESVIERYPNHPGALHLYIHAVEKERPELGVVAADRLGNLVPGAGHLVHMPSHIYIRVGRYHDAIVSNQRATEADQDYVTQCYAQGLYPLAYMPHNHHFLWFAAIMDGEQAVALDAAQHTAHMADQTLMREPGYGALQHFSTIPLYTLVRFEQWDDILATPAPDADLLYPTGVWHFARGLAFAAQDRLSEAQQELSQVQVILASPALESVALDLNQASHILSIAVEVLSGQIAAQAGDYATAIAHLQTGVTLEDQLSYTEPALWAVPVRQTLAAVFLQADRPAEAEQTYREDLTIYPENGWSLDGLARSLEAQGSHY